MENLGQGDPISLFLRLEEWSRSKELKPDEMGRIIAIILVMIVISYIILYVARIVVALALPTLVIVGLLLIYRFVSLNEVGDGFKDLPNILDSLKNFLKGFMANGL